MLEGIVYEISVASYQKANSLLPKGYFIGWEREGKYFTDLQHLQELPIDAADLEKLTAFVKENIVQSESNNQLSNAQLLHIEQHFNIADLLKRIEALENNQAPSASEIEKAFLLQNATSAPYIERRYNKTNANKNGFSLLEIATWFEVKTVKPNGRTYSKKELANMIFEAIKAER
ncbi:MAG: hypothetical protein AAF599_09670 [Bacteroidota bacterium]